jgi:hypothetical protein
MRILHITLLFVLAFFLQGFASNAPSSGPGSASHMRQMQQDIQSQSSKTTDERQSRMLDKAAEVAGKAALAVDAGDGAAAKEHTQFAILMLAEAARECANITPLANQLADAYAAQGFRGQWGAEGIKKLFSLVEVLKKAKASTDFGSFSYASAIREVIAAIYDYTDHGFDGQRVSTALKWLIWAAASNGYSEAAIAELLDYLEFSDDLSGEKKAEIAEDIRKLAELAEEETRKLEEIGGGRIRDKETAEAKRILEEIREEGRRMSEARKARYREEARREEEEERRQQQESTQDPDPHQAPPQPTTLVQLTSLEGPTEVSREPIGELHSIHIIAVDGKEMEKKEQLKVDDHKDTFTIELPLDPDVGSVLFGGSNGHLAIYQDRWLGGVTPSFGPRDLVIVSRNGTINETVVTRSPSGIGLTGGPMEDEVAIQGSGIQPNPSGKSDVVLTDRGQPIASGQFDSWGYEVTSTEVTQRDVWTPIFFKSVGVEPTQRLQITLTPTEGQIIEPLEVVVTGIETEQVIQIAQLKTEILGPQNFYAMVEKME